MEDYQVWERAAERAVEMQDTVSMHALVAGELLCDDVDHSDQCKKLDDVFGNCYFDVLLDPRPTQDERSLALCFMAAISRDEKWNLELE